MEKRKESISSESDISSELSNLSGLTHGSDPGDLVAAGCDDGGVVLLKLSPSLSTSHREDKVRLTDRSEESYSLTSGNTSTTFRERDQARKGFRRNSKRETS